MVDIGKRLSYDPVDFDPENLSQGGKLKEFAVPILAILSFAAILMIFTIPSINNLTGAYEERDAVTAQLNDKKAELEDLQNLRNTNQTNKGILDRLQIIIPTSQTEVVNFVNKVEQVSRETTVEFKDAVAGERSVLDSSGRATTRVDERNLKLLQIPVNFSLVGSLGNLRTLLVRIYNSDDFIVMTKMQLDNRQEDESGAQIELELSKYQYNPPSSKEDYEALLKSISYKERPDQDVIDFIRRKTEISNGTL